MIEWWQAGLISMPSAILGGLVVGGTTLVLQKRQHRHDVEMQAQRLEAERQRQRMDAVREQNKRMAAPLYDFLEIVERRQGDRFLGMSLRAKGMKERVEDVLKARLAPEVHEAFVRAITTPEVNWLEVNKKYMGRIVTIPHEDLRLILTKLLTHICTGEKGWLSGSEISTLIVEARGILATGITAPDLLATASSAEGKREVP